jgi:hypothetical protein
VIPHIIASVCTVLGIVGGTVLATWELCTWRGIDHREITHPPL